MEEPQSKEVPTPDSELIHLEDVITILHRSVDTEDRETSEYVKKQKFFFAKLRIKRLNKYIHDLWPLWNDASKMEMYVAYEICNNCDDMAIKICREDFRKQVREEIKVRMGLISELPIQPPPTAEEEEESPDDEDDSDFINTEIQPKSHQHQHSNGMRPKGMTQIDPDKLERPKEIDPATWNSWSKSRKTSYFLEDSYPNAYYYRHNSPGEKQKNGKWSPEEKKLFLKRYEEMSKTWKGGSGDWGLFSKTIPGRVGYQCSNYYRKLIKSGEIKDDNYVMGDDGKLHHLSRVQIKNGEVIPNHYKKGKNRIPETSKPEKKKRHYKTRLSAANMINRVETLKLFSSKLGMKASEMCGRYAEWAEVNPLHGLIDQLTQKPMRVPTISPDGYVLDYQTWVDTLNRKKENPFTRVPLNKRQLVRLTVYNIQKYRDKIKNLDQKDLYE